LPAVVVVAAVMDTVAALLDTEPTLAVIPVGLSPTVEQSRLVYQVIVPLVPALTLLVVTA
jgi:hypothetical protein